MVPMHVVFASPLTESDPECKRERKEGDTNEYT
jgi:hypothetical protein